MEPSRASDQELDRKAPAADFAAQKLAGAHITAREKLYAYLEAHPGGADAAELAGLLFQGVSADAEISRRVVNTLLAGNPSFVVESASGIWSLKSNDRYRVAIDDAQFTVVDLETTGGRAGPGTIIEIGAYKMIGRRMVDSFSTLVRPQGIIPHFITGLTSISNEMVASAPSIESVLPQFRDFMGDSVMVAHNAAFDRGFLDFEYRRIFGLGLVNPVLCTLRMSRRFVPSLKRRRLDAIAEFFGLSTAGRHRGLGDARMAAEILSIFLDIAGQMGITRLDRLLDDHGRGLSGQRFERHIGHEEVASLPHQPGIYIMRNERGDILYIGKARHLRDRVSSYFTSSVTAKTADLVAHAYKIETRVAASALDAALLEARLIRELKPPYNRMLKSAAPAYFIKIDLDDDFPRIAIGAKMTARSGVLQLGPFIGRKSLDSSVRALARILGLRTCTGKLKPDPDYSPCIYGQMGHCAAPCNAAIDADAYRVRIHKAIAFLRGRSGALLGDLARARDQAARALRYEEAGRLSRDLEALATLANRASRLSRVVTENNLVIIIGDPGTDDPQRGRKAHVVLAGRLALTRAIDSPDAGREIAEFVRDHFDHYRARPVARGELEAMAIVARWLGERTPDEGRLIYLTGPHLDAAALAI